MIEFEHRMSRQPRIKHPAASFNSYSDEELEGEVFEQMGWRLTFRTLDGKAAVQIERPPELCRRDAWLRVRLARLKLWNEEPNEPAPGTGGDVGSFSPKSRRQHGRKAAEREGVLEPFCLGIRIVA